MTPQEYGQIRGPRLSEAEFRRMWTDPALTIAEIARRLGISRAAVSSRAQVRKLPPRGDISLRLRRAITDPEFAAMWKAGVRYGDLIKHYGVAIATPATTAARLGLPKRGKDKHSAISLETYQRQRAIQPKAKPREPVTPEPRKRLTDVPPAALSGHKPALRRY